MDCARLAIFSMHWSWISLRTQYQVNLLTNFRRMAVTLNYILPVLPFLSFVLDKTKMKNLSYRNVTKAWKLWEPLQRRILWSNQLSRFPVPTIPRGNLDQLRWNNFKRNWIYIRWGYTRFGRDCKGFAGEKREKARTIFCWWQRMCWKESKDWK